MSVRCARLAARVCSASSFATLTLFMLCALAASSPVRAMADTSTAIDALSPGPRVEASARTWTHAGAAAAAHPSFYFPISNIPIEDVDAVEVATTNPSYTDLVVWPTEGAVYFFSVFGTPGLIASIPTFTPGITGNDFYANPAATYGVYQTLGAFYIYDLTGAVPVLASSGFLPGPVPIRRDIDPIIFADPGSPSGESVIFETGTGLHCRTIPAGFVRWDLYLPAPMVEAIDPAMSPNGHLFCTSVGFMTVIDPVAGAIQSTTALGSVPVREVDVRFSGGLLGPGAPLAWLPTNYLLHIFDDTAGSAGLPIAGTPVGLPGQLIEGNDLEWNPDVTFGYLPTLPFMVQLDPTIPGGMMLIGLPPAAHQRNQDAVFVPLGFGARKWVYAMQGTMVIGDDMLFAPGPVFLPNPGVTYDGVDPAFSDTPPYGNIVSIATSAGTNVYNAPGTFFMGTIPRTPGAGPLRTDVDHKPGPQFGNYLMQPTIGGMIAVGGFGPNDWVVTVANGLEVVDLAAMAVVEFMPYALLGAPGSMTYRGGDAQPLFNAGFPPEPRFSVDEVDQDFVTKCWEYKYAMNRWPYWYSRTIPAYYPHYLPYGVFGPPALIGWDIMNRDQVIVCSNQLTILNHFGSPLYNIPFPGFPIGGLVWDWDNKICKLRLQGQLEMIVNLTPVGYGNPPAITFATYGSYVRWYPIIDRMNGWEFVVRRGGRELWVYDHASNFLVTTLTLPARCIRRPVFDDQRKTLCLPLANRTMFYFNAHAFRTGQPYNLYAWQSPVLPGHIVADPVFDFYNHHTVLQLSGPQICILDNANGLVRYTSPILPYTPMGPLQIDCYNKICKGFYRSPTTYYELWMNLYPMVFGGPPTNQWITLSAAPYGYPQFDSMDGWEVYRLGTNIIQARNLWNNAFVLTINTPFPIRGNLFIDRVNKYLVCALQGPRVYWIDLFKWTSGAPGSSQVVNLPYPNSAQATDDIVFLTQLRKAMIHVDVVPGIQTEMVALELRSANPVTYPSFTTLPRINKQMYQHPFAGVVTYPWYDSGLGQGGEVTVDMTPTTYSPPQQPFVNHLTLPCPPTDAFDSTPPPGAFTIAQQPAEPGDAVGVVGFTLTGLEPGSTVLADATSDPGMEPTVDTADEDGVAEGFTFGFSAGTHTVCFTEIDPAGNAAPPKCINAQPLSVPGGDLPSRFAFRLSSEQPVRGEARFALSLPEGGRVRLGIYDVTGRLRATVEDGVRSAGEHELVWNRASSSRPVEPGVYFARLTSPLGKATVRLVVVQ